MVSSCGFSNNNKKKAYYARCLGTGSSAYDDGLYYLSTTIFDLLSAYYYLKQNQKRLIPEKEYEYNYQNQEGYFINRLILSYIDMNLSKFFDTDPRNWCFERLLSTIENQKWSDYQEISEDIKKLEVIVKPVKLFRNTLVAHTSCKNDPNTIHFDCFKYGEIILGSMILLDKFTDGEIPYKLTIADENEVDLRTILRSSSE
jgi:hypothetical protein